jgi:oxygen-independent coproporphyrinogen-3 oxidase
VQSFNQAYLTQLGRIHTREQALNSIELARRAGYRNLSVDLMFALPGQSSSQLQADLDELVSLAPEHISIYGLTFEKGTEFATKLRAGEIQPCPDNIYAEQYRLIDDLLQTAGFEHYEISNFSRPGKRCRHNQVYWQRQACLAVGAGAHAFLAKGWGERWHIPAELKKYHDHLIRGLNPARLLERFDHQGAMIEYAYLALRTRDGIDTDDFKRRFGSSAEKIFARPLEQVKGYLRRKDSTCSFSLDGWLLYDHLISYFL